MERLVKKTETSDNKSEEFRMYNFFDLNPKSKELMSDAIEYAKKEAELKGIQQATADFIKMIDKIFDGTGITPDTEMIDYYEEKLGKLKQMLVEK